VIFNREQRVFKTFLRTRGCLLAAGALVVLLSGCGGKRGPRLYHVNGSVHINGEPARDMNVMFTPLSPPEDGSTPLSPSGVTEEDGSFRLMSFEPDDGAPAGDYQVTISFPMSRFNKNLNGIDRLKGKFANPKTSGLTATVEPKSNDLKPFDLKAIVLPQQGSVDGTKMYKKNRDR
jgi:hypothetical protein